jgi:hypothetical protein
MEAVKVEEEPDERARALLGDPRPCRRCGRVYTPRSRNQAFCTLGCRRMFARLIKMVRRASLRDVRGRKGPTRYEQFSAARAEGLTTRQIATRFGVSTQRVLQVLGARKLASGAGRG